MGSVLKQISSLTAMMWNLLSKALKPFAYIAMTMWSVIKRLMSMVFKIVKPFWGITLKILKPIIAIIWTIIGPFVGFFSRILDKTPIGRVARATGKYLSGSWSELGKVKWPTNQETWSMAGVVLAFTTVMTVLIVIIDSAFGAILRRVIS